MTGAGETEVRRRGQAKRASLGYILETSGGGRGNGGGGLAHAGWGGTTGWKIETRFWTSEITQTGGKGTKGIQ